MKKNYFEGLSTNHIPNTQPNITLLFCLLLLSVGGWAQQSYTFTNAGATGSVGPTAAMINTAYASTNLSGNVTVIGLGIQQWTVPVTGGYRIEAYGAEGGTSGGVNPGANGGLGAVIKGDFTLTAGQVINIVVGQKGSGSNYGGSGGGGSYVVAPGNVPLCVAGAGGGAIGYPGYSNGYTNGGAGLITTTGGNSNVQGGGTYGVQATGPGGGAPGFGGTIGYGGGSGVASAGGGFVGDGANGGTPTNPTYSGGGKSYLNGSSGGIGAQGITNSGGFGGGGGTQAASGYGAGGGGYSGGGGGSLTGGLSGNGGGGGSYNGGVNQNNTAGINSGHGKVIIAELCNISLTASGTYSLAPSICVGQSVTLTTNAVSNYAWSNGNTTTNSIVVSPTSTTVYTLSAMSVSNCIAVKSITVIVNGGQPTLSVISSTNQTCLGKTATLTASGAVNYTWTNGVTNGVSFYPSTTTTYTVSGENGCGIVTAVSTISVSPLPVSVVSTATAVCVNKTATLTVTAPATSYTLLPLNTVTTNSNMIVNPQVNTVYTITASDGTCAGTANVSLQANPVPTISSQASSTLVCPGNTLSLSASGGNNYTWTPGNLNGSNITVSPTVSALYSVTGDNSFGCFGSSSQVIVVGIQPNLVVTAGSATICSGDSFTLSASGANTYVWSHGPTTNSTVVTPLVSTTYTVEGANSTSGCTDTKVVALSVFIPTVAVSGNTSICSGGTATLSAVGAGSFTWNPGGIPFGGISVSPASTTIYTVNAIGQQGALTCPASATFEVLVNPTPTVSASGVKPAVCVKETNTLSANGAQTYTWVSTNTTVVAPSLTVSSTTAGITVYTVTGVNAQGCEASITVASNISACTALTEAAAFASSLVVYPNPNNGQFVLQGSKEMALSLVNTLGQEVTKIQLNESNGYSSSVTGIAEGVYFIVSTNLNLKVIVTK